MTVIIFQVETVRVEKKIERQVVSFSIQFSRLRME